jgi:dCMP deaminase
MAEEKRLSWDEYFLSLVTVIGKRATCDRGKSGCLVVKDKRILCTGYVGSPPGFPHCGEVGHLMKKVIGEDGKESLHCVRTIHAEQNAIMQAAKYGTPIDGATIYCTMEPCRTCAMLIIACGIKRVVCQKRYHAAQETRDMFKQAGLQLDVVEENVEKYDRQ